MSVDMKSFLREYRSNDSIVLGDLNRWLLSNPDPQFDPWVVDIIAEQLNGPKYTRVGMFRSSSAGRCERAQVFSYLGQPTSDGAQDPVLTTIFQDGKFRHLRFQALCLQAGIITSIEDALTWPRMSARGTTDGTGVVRADHPVTRYRGKEFGLELKGMNSFGYKRRADDDGEIKEEHLDQTSRNLLLGGYDLYVIIYEDKNTQQQFEWVIEPDADRLDAQIAELKRLNRAVRQKKLPNRLPDCQRRKGDVFGKCSFGGKQGTCDLARGWPGA
jgi:hypothetical protein